MINLFYSSRTIFSALLVEVESESAKAIKFKVVACPKASLWFPKKAIKAKYDDDGDVESYELAFWFNLESFASNIFSNYASHHRR